MATSEIGKAGMTTETYTTTSSPATQISAGDTLRKQIIPRRRIIGSYARRPRTIRSAAADGEINRHFPDEKRTDLQPDTS